jgi:zinc transporter 9
LAICLRLSGCSAVSDGLAVGAASLSSVPEISLGVTAAMVVHKGPVAVGLSTFLQSASWSPAQINKGLLLFAAASPLAAVLTYGLLSAVPGITDNIPLVVLFSGGTVMYAATVHILPSAMHAGPIMAPGCQDHEHTGRPHGDSSGRPQLLLVSLGMLLPLVLSAAFGHGHHHHH